MLKNVVKVLLSNAVLAFIGLLNSVIFPVLLEVEEYAYYQEFMLYLSYINICHLGIASGMFLNYAGKKYHETDRCQYKSEVYLILLILLFFTVSGVIISAIAKNSLFLFVAFSIFPYCSITSFQALYQAWERFTEYAIINAFPKVLVTSVSVMVYFVYQKLTGHLVVALYVIITWGVTLYFIIEFAKFTKGIKRKKIFSSQNIKTSLNGFLITLGNYVNLLFHSIDKQFVNLLYNTTAFAIYSFAMSLQNIMMLFITALANPFYPKLAKENIDKKYIQQLKEILFMFGAYSGCAYFAVSFIVKNFIRKYVASLEVVAVFFAVFPAMAVINVIYINLYKIKRFLKKYILTLIGMLCIASLLNITSVILQGGYVGISLMTMISYYIWLLYSQHDFEEICLEIKDYIYLLGFLIFYFMIMVIKNDIIGFFLYALIISIWNVFIYKKTIIYIAKKFLRIKTRS